MQNDAAPRWYSQSPTGYTTVVPSGGLVLGSLAVVGLAALACSLAAGPTARVPPAQRRP